MPAVSEKQEKFMRAVANSPKFAKKVGVPQSVGREYTKGSKMGYRKVADGVASKGKTKGTMIDMPGNKMTAGEKKPKKMAYGGKVKMMNGGMPKTKMNKAKC